MASSQSTQNDSSDVEQHDREFLELLQTASDPSSSTVSSDQLAKKLGIDGLPTREEALKILQDEILAPVRDLSGPDLSRWQTYIPSSPALSLDTRSDMNYRQSPIELPIPNLTLAPLPATHMILPLSKGIDGAFSTWREALAPKPPAHPALSSSTTRAPGSSKNFVRGKGSYAPFLPGGLDEVEDLQGKGETEGEGEQAEEEDEDGWKTRAPGFKRGVQLSGGTQRHSPIVVLLLVVC